MANLKTIKQPKIRGSIPSEVLITKKENDLYQYFTKAELKNTAKELAYIKEHSKEYKSYNNIEDLKVALLSDA